MKRLKVLKNSLLFLMILIAVVACNDKEDPFSADGDVVFIKKKINDQTVIGTAYFLYANQGVDSVTVTLPGSGQVLALEQYETSTYSFYREPKNEDFITGIPTIGDYLFKVNSIKGEYLEVYDEQDFYNLPFPEIDSMRFDQSKLWFFVKWKDVQGADGYVARLYKTSGEMLFNGYSITAEKPEYYISDFHITGAWYGKPVYAEKYILKIIAIKYDEGATDDNSFFNVQELCETTQEIIWQIQ